MGTGTSTTGRNGRGNGGKAKPTARANGWHGDGVDYATIPADLVHSIVKAVAGAGGAVMFGQTRDGGAFSIMVLVDNEKVKEYPRDEEEVRRVLNWITDEYLI